MATGPQLVHKQFNSPIGLYSRQNIEETLNKHIHHLENGATGIDFNDPATGKTANLANSAVLRMLEEEERARQGYPKKKVVWPPVPESNGHHDQQEHSAPAHTIPGQQYQQYSHQQQLYSPENQQYLPQQQYSPQKQQFSPQPKQYPPQQQYTPQQQYQQQQFASQPQSQPAFCEGRRQEPAAINRLIPVSSGVSPRPGPLSPQVPSQQAPRWNPQGSLQSSSNYHQPSYSPQQQYSLQQQQYSSEQQQQYSTQQQQFSPSQQQYPPQALQQQFSPPPQPTFSPPPTTVTLRPHQPVHQRPPPVYASQPAAASFQGGVNMRGDLKWPPQIVKEAVAAENEARRQLAKGPACRPRRVNKDYTAFFAQNALNQSYPGYRVPPGTQHIVDNTVQTGTSSY